MISDPDTTERPMAEASTCPSEARTFLIADVRGYTRFTQQHGDEAAARLATQIATSASSAAAYSALLAVHSRPHP
jgi:class 3 adenylate cyclase